ncbi:type I-E CRISPR-associated protein Cas7/Cse4/CasC [Streptomyces sp. NPDC046925]|uniref:type I-E CRISPR-associated protein Cas7/Cse4/CasC n=1 Tax=Streptomyces sp. NPDC046925 TaxID=3155375 RepID=UPI0033C17E4E
MNQYLNLHALTTFNSVLLVRDENGQAKQTPFGTAPRHMVTSFCQRRAERTYLRDQANLAEGALAPYAFGTRTREWGRLAADILACRDWTYPEAMGATKESLQALGINFGTKDSTADLTKVLIFAPDTAAEQIADALDEHRTELTAWLADVARAREEMEKQKNKKGKKKTDAEADGPAESAGSGGPGKAGVKVPPLPRRLKKKLLTALAPADAIDIALFGRFLAEVAESPDVDGALQSMNSITVHPASGVEDFYSAADDSKLRRRTHRTPSPNVGALDALEEIDALNQAAEGEEEQVREERGAGLTGYQSLTSGTFLSHTVLDRHQLRRNLTEAGMSEEAAETAARAAEAAFIEAFCNAVPAAKKNNTAAPGTMRKLVHAFTSARPYNYVSCFEDAVDEKNGPASLQATRRLLDQHALISRKNGVEPGAVLTYDLAVTQLLQDLRDQGRLQPTEVDTPRDLATTTPVPAPAGAPA